MSDHRTVLPDARGDAARMLHAAARERLRVAIADLFLPAHLRLTEWQRTVMHALLERLVDAVEDELRAGLAGPLADHEGVQAVLAAEAASVARTMLHDTAALRDPALVALLLHRAEEHRLHRGAHADPAAADGLLSGLVRDVDDEVAGAAMAVLIAQGRRLDRFQEPLLPLHELPAEIGHRLVWSIAAALRSWLVDRHDVSPDRADDALAVAATRTLAGHDEGENLQARCLKLAALLDERNRLDGAFLVRALPDGGLSLLLAALSVRCGLALEAVWELASEPLGRGLPLLLRAAGLDRGEAGRILVAMQGEPSADPDSRLVRQLDLFDTTAVNESRRTLRLWRADPFYRSAAEAAVL